MLSIYANDAHDYEGPGYHVAERSLGVSIMRILWAFDVKPSSMAKLPLDPSKYRGQPPGNPNSDLPVSLLPRNGKDELIRKAFDDAMQNRAPMVCVQCFISSFTEPILIQDVKRLNSDIV